jgi:PKD repeat protein
LAVTPRSHRSPAGLAGLAACLALVPGVAAAQAPLFAFAQISDIEVDDPTDQARFAHVLATLAAAGAPGALLPHPLAAVFLAGDLVETPGDAAGWDALVTALASGLTADGIPFLAVPGNHDQNEFGPVLYEQHIAGAGVWDVSSAALRGQNGLTTATGWEGLRFVGFNSSYAGWNTVSATALAQVEAIASAATAAGESVFLVAHHPHDDLGPIPLASALEIPGVVGYLRGHGGSPHAAHGLAGIANPVWDLSSHAVWQDGALIYYEAYPDALRAYVLALAAGPTSLPPPAVIALPHPLVHAAPPGPPAAAFAAAPQLGQAPREVAFVDLSTGQPTAWLWDFGDGGSSDERHPVHLYEQAGSYDVTLVASNAQDSDASTQLGAVQLLPPAPSASFEPVADARVSSASPASNFGDDQTVRARFASTTAVESYLRFAVDPLGGPIAGAVLRLHVTEPSVEGGAVRAASAAWDEATLTWENAPGAIGAVLDSAGIVFPGQWVDFDVSDLVSGPGSYDFVLSSSSSNAVSYSSREGANPPRLVVTTAASVSSLRPAGAALLSLLLGAAGAWWLSRSKRSS